MGIFLYSTPSLHLMVSSQNFAKACQRKHGAETLFQAELTTWSISGTKYFIFACHQWLWHISALFDQGKVNALNFVHKCANAVAYLTKSKYFKIQIQTTVRLLKLERHVLRIYHQMQTWCGVEKKLQEYGWKRTAAGLNAIRTTKEPASDALLRSISCKCQTGCGVASGSRKISLKCSVLCLHCNCTGDTILKKAPWFLPLRWCGKNDINKHILYKELYIITYPPRITYARGQ